MAEPAIQMCCVCGQNYNTSVLRIVRNQYRANRRYAVICAGCQSNVSNAKTPEEESKK